MANPLYVANNIPCAPPAEPIYGTNDLQVYTSIAGLGALAQAAGIPGYGGDHYYNGATIISTNFTNPATIAAWDGSWAMPLIVNDGTTFIGGSGPGRQPQTGSQAIDFDGSTYACGAYDASGNTSVYISNAPKSLWTLVNFNTSATFDTPQALKWFPRFNLWLAVGDQIWTAPQGAAVWTSRSNADFYSQIYDDGATVWVIGTTDVWHSTDLLSWSSTAIPANFPRFTNAPAPLWYSSRLGKWFGVANKGGSSPDPHNGIVATTAPNVAWTYIYTSAADPPSVPADDFTAISEVGNTVYIIGRRITQVSPFVTQEALIAKTTDGSAVTITVPTLPETPSTPESELTDIIGAPDNSSLGISLKNPNATHEFTNTYSTDGGATLVNQFLGGQFHQIIEALPPPPPHCVDFEIQSPGDMPDSGAQFTGQRLYITANLNVSGVPQVITPTLIVDGAEIVLPQITNTERGTIELPISKYHGRFFDGVRLDGCLTGRIEIFRIEADVWLGEQSENG